MKVKPLISLLFVVGLIGGSVIAASQRADIDSLRDRYVNQGTGSSTGNWLLDHTKIGAQLNVDGAMSNRTRLDLSGRDGTSGAFMNSSNTIITSTGIGNVLPSGSHMSSDLNLNNSLISAEFMPADWINTHIEITGIDRNTVANTGKAGVTVDVARITFGNLARMPYFASVGRDYIAFGSYGDAHPLTPTLTQTLSQINATQLAVGFAQPCGFSGSAYIFRGMNKINSGYFINSTSVPSIAVVNSVNAFTSNGGLDGSYDWSDGQRVKGVNLNVGWLYNMADAMNVAPYLSSGLGRYSKAVGGLALSASGYYQQIDAKISYVGAVNRFSGTYDNLAFNNTPSEPKAVAVELGYGFNAVGHEHRIAVGYQRSYQALAIGLPESRWEGDWTISLAKNTNLQLQYTHDRDYSTTTSGNLSIASIIAGQAGLTPGPAVWGTGLNADTVKARVTVDLL